MSANWPTADFVAAIVRQFRCFGILANAPNEEMRSANRERFISLAIPRLAVWLNFVTYSQDDPGVRQTLAGMPILYNTALWPEQAPLAGYFEPDGPVPPATHLMSHIAFWMLQLDAPAEASVPKLVRAAAWLLQYQPLEEVLRYLLELLWHGFIIDADSIGGAMYVLLRARACVAGDSALVARLVDLGSAQRRGWPTAELRIANLESAPVIRDNQDAALGLLDLAEQYVDLVLASTNLDDWILGQYFLADMLTLVRRIMEEEELWDALPCIARTTRLEEIRADAGAHRLAYAVKDGSGSHPFRHSFDIFPWFIAQVFMSTDASDWKERFTQERALVPQELQEILLHSATPFEEAARLPERWQRFSSVMAPLFGDYVIREPRFAVIRWRRFSPCDAAAGTLAEPFFREHEIAVPAVRTALILLACEDHGQFHPSDEHRLALETLQAAGFAAEAAYSFAHALAYAMSFAEVEHALDEVAQARSAGDEAAALTTLCSLGELYPYLDFCHFERAIALDMTGQRSDALQAILTAILLQPCDRMRWHSLGVILKKLGDLDLAIRAVAVSQQLNEQAND